MLIRMNTKEYMNFKELITKLVGKRSIRYNGILSFSRQVDKKCKTYRYSIILCKQLNLLYYE